MCRVIATYPVANSARITAMTRNAAGIPVSPVVAYAGGITPAATVSGATPARTKNSTAGTPSRSRASARDTALGLAGAGCIPDITVSGFLLAVVSGRSGAVGEQGAVDGGLGLADQLVQVRSEQRDCLLRAAAGWGGGS